jgi:hypothetical protein
MGKNKTEKVVDFNGTSHGSVNPWWLGVFGEIKKWERYRRTR